MIATFNPHNSQYGLAIVAISFYRLRSESMARRWGGGTEHPGWPRWWSGKLEFECGEPDPSTGLLTYWCYFASMGSELTAWEGQLSGLEPGWRPHQETPGPSCLCDAVSSCWGNGALWIPRRKRYELLAKERNQQKEICIKMRLPFVSNYTSLHTQCGRVPADLRADYKSFW